MGRKKKYENMSLMTVSMDSAMLVNIDKAAKNQDMSRSEFIVNILESVALNEKEFCRVMAKRAAQDLCYWQNKVDLAEHCKQIDGVGQCLED